MPIKTAALLCDTCHRCVSKAMLRSGIRRSSGRRRLFPPEGSTEPEVSSLYCSLCSGQHQQLSLPCTWKSEPAQLLARSLQLDLDKPVCHPCRDDISRLLKNLQHQPRWAKVRNKSCCMPGCSRVMFAQSNIASQNSSRPLTNDTEHETQSLPTPAPLCKAHYQALYNELQPTQTHCVTCGSDLRKTTVCVCPDPQTIQKYLAE